VFRGHSHNYPEDALVWCVGIVLPGNPHTDSGSALVRFAGIERLLGREHLAGVGIGMMRRACIDCRSGIVLHQRPIDFLAGLGAVLEADPSNYSQQRPFRKAGLVPGHDYLTVPENTLLKMAGIVPGCGSPVRPGVELVPEVELVGLVLAMCPCVGLVLGVELIGLALPLHPAVELVRWAGSVETVSPMLP
jgi:hypothetical protein